MQTSISSRLVTLLASVATTTVAALVTALPMPSLAQGAGLSGSCAKAGQATEATASGCTCELPRYPARALRLEQQGVVETEVAISPEVRVVATRIVKSSGHAELDHGTLEHVARMCYRAGKDAQGNPAGGTVRTSFTWRLD